MHRGTRQHDHSNHVVHVPETIGSTDNQLNLVVGSLDTSVREPLNNSLYAVPTRCISRHLSLIQVISA